MRHRSTNRSTADGLLKESDDDVGKSKPVPVVRAFNPANPHFFKPKYQQPSLFSRLMGGIMPNQTQSTNSKPLLPVATAPATPEADGGIKSFMSFMTNYSAYQTTQKDFSTSLTGSLDIVDDYGAIDTPTDEMKATNKVYIPPPVRAEPVISVAKTRVYPAPVKFQFLPTEINGNADSTQAFPSYDTFPKSDTRIVSKMELRERLLREHKIESATTQTQASVYMKRL